MILTLLHHTTHIYLHTTTGNNCEATQKQRVVSNKMARDKAEHYGMCVCVSRCAQLLRHNGRARSLLAMRATAAVLVLWR